jgi:type I restriction enzyme R subunit
MVRTKRRLVEKYAESGAWQTLDVPEQAELVREVAALPTALSDADLDAKHFDLLLLNLQLCVLRAEPRFESLKDKVVSIASALEEKQTIPMVRDQMRLIQDVQTAEFWQAVTVSELEQVRLRLRALVKFIEKLRRKPVFADFEDQMRASEPHSLPGISVGVDTEKFREKALAFLRDKLDEPALHKVRWNEPLTPEDLSALERMLVDAGVGTATEIEEVARKETSLGLFLRSLVGLDRAAAKRAFSGFIETRHLSASQLDFVNLIVEHLTQCGWMRPEQLYSSPFTDQFVYGPNAVFVEQPTMQALVAALESVRRNAMVV